MTPLTLCRSVIFLTETNKTVKTHSNKKNFYVIDRFAIYMIIYVVTIILGYCLHAWYQGNTAYLINQIKLTIMSNTQG